MTSRKPRRQQYSDTPEEEVTLLGPQAHREDEENALNAIESAQTLDQDQEVGVGVA